mgnify:CR=1 FL=1
MDQQSNISDTIRILSGRIESEINRLRLDTLDNNKQTDSLVFIGNWQDAIPRSIWVDALLSAIDVRCWGVIRTQAVSGSAVMLSLNNLLKDTLGYSNATVSRVIFILRLSRWISLCSTLRTETGKFRGHVYAIHDKPVSLEDAIYLDRHYIEFVKKQTSHNNHAIKTLAQSVWQFISQVVHQENSFQTPLLNQGIYDGLNQLVNKQASAAKRNQHMIHVYNLNVDENSPVQKLNVATKHQVQILNMDGLKNESIENQQDSIQVQKLNVAPICSSRCSSSSLNKKTSTTNAAGISKQNEKEIQENLIYPKAFNSNENKLAKMYLKKIELDCQQDFLDETAAQIKQRSKTSNPIRNAIGYLAWLCNEHGKGNTYLTSAYMKHQEQRERKQARERKIKQQQQEITAASVNGGNVREIIVQGENCKELEKQKQSKAPNNRWGGVNHAVKPKHR